MGILIHYWLKCELVQQFWKKNLPLSTQVDDKHITEQSNSSPWYIHERNKTHMLKATLLAIAKISIYSEWINSDIVIQ